MLGQRKGRLQVIERLPNDKRRETMWKCQCDCGNETAVRGTDLRKGATQSCGCLRRERMRQITQKLPYLWMLNAIKWNAKKRGWSSELSYQDLLEFVKIKKCHYCNDIIEWKLHQCTDGIWSNAYHLDRIDNSKTYSKENCVVCCTRCNYGKCNLFTYDEWYGMTEFFRKKSVIN
jgi:hypothetical protein